MRIEALTLTGLGRAEDGSHWPRTLPGEEIDAEGRILVPSADRVAAPCPHYKGCGGCALMHASDAFVAAWKQEIVRRALAARGIAAEVAGIETSPPESRRRAKLSGRRTKAGAIVGFHGRASDTIVPVPDCRLVTPSIRALMPVLRDITARIGSRKGELDFTVTDSPEGADVAIDGGKTDLSPDVVTDLGALARGGGIARLTWNGEAVLTLVGPGQSMGPARVVPPPGGFLQATTHGQAVLTRLVMEATEGAARVADLFAGAGTFALPLATRAEVHAVESDAASLAALDAGWRHGTGLRRVTTEVRDLFRQPLRPDELTQDAAVLDPPRAGAEAQVAQIAASALPLVAMVSCNPVTFARDAATLIEAGFAAGPLTVIDQFRWSAHVELFAAFRRS